MNRIPKKAAAAAQKKAAPPKKGKKPAAKPQPQWAGIANQMLQKPGPGAC